MIEESAFRSVFFRIGIFAMPRQAVVAEKAMSACDRKRNNDAIAALQGFHVGSCFFDYAHELMPENEILFLRNESIQNVQIGTAYRGRSDAQDDVVGFFDSRIVNLIDLNMAGSMENERFHAKNKRRGR